MYLYIYIFKIRGGFTGRVKDCGRLMSPHMTKLPLGSNPVPSVLKQHLYCPTTTTQCCYKTYPLLFLRLLSDLKFPLVGIKGLDITESHKCIFVFEVVFLQN